MKHQSFESYLQERFMSEYPELCGNKDAYMENFEKWLPDLQVDDLIKYADDWGKVITF